MPISPGQGPPPKDDPRDLYFSFWSWQLLKNCPLSYKLIVLDKRDVDRKKRDFGTAIQGSVAHAQSEDFFRLPKGQRDMQWFLDTFDAYYKKLVKDNYIDWVAHGIRHLRKRQPYKDMTPEEVVAKLGESRCREEGKESKRKETYGCTVGLMKLVSAAKLHTLDVRTEVPFRVIVQQASSTGSAYTPSITIGGRIDLVFDITSAMVEIWDVKGIKNPKDLDTDQVLIYRLGMQAQGKAVRRQGYLLLKQEKHKAVQFNVGHANQLFLAMRMASVHFRNNQWPANYKSWKCGWCDVRDLCPTYQNRHGQEEELKKMLPGKVTWNG